MNHFKPHPLLFNGHLQTIFAHLFSTPPQLADTELHTVQLADNDRLVLHANVRNTSSAKHSSAVLLLHGLGGSGDSDYNLRLVPKLNAHGWDVFRFNHRGCGPNAIGQARGVYHAGRIEDLDCTIRYILSTFNYESLQVIGFSLSGNLLLRYLGETQFRDTHRRISRALAVCPPIDLEMCSLALAQRKNLILDKYYTKRMMRIVQQRKIHFPDEAVITFPRRNMDLRKFDELFTAPQSGFVSRKAYYQYASALQHMSQITVPSTILAAADDPLVPPPMFDHVYKSPFLTLNLQKYGGHMGFISSSKTRFRDFRWMDQFIVDWAHQS